MKFYIILLKYLHHLTLFNDNCLKVRKNKLPGATIRPLPNNGTAYL